MVKNSFKGRRHHRIVKPQSRGQLAAAKACAATEDERIAVEMGGPPSEEELLHRAWNVGERLRSLHADWVECAAASARACAVECNEHGAAGATRNVA